MAPSDSIIKQLAQLSLRHCERTRSNRSRGNDEGWIASELALLAMTGHTFAVPRMRRMRELPIGRGRAANSRHAQRLRSFDNQRASAVSCGRRNADMPDAFPLALAPLPDDRHWASRGRK